MVWRCSHSVGALFPEAWPATPAVSEIDEIHFTARSARLTFYFDAYSRALSTEMPRPGIEPGTFRSSV